MKRRSFISLLAGLFVAPKKILAQPEEIVAPEFESWNIDCVSQLKIMRPRICEKIQQIRVDHIVVSAEDPDRWLFALDRKIRRITGTHGEEIAIPGVVVKGPIQRVTKVTTYNQFRKIYGGPDRSTRVPDLDAKIRAALVGYRG